MARLAHLSASLQSAGATRIVQRKVGFEFEDSSWRAWRKAPPTAPPPAAAATAVSSAAEGPALVYPVKRKEVLHRSTNFTLEGDDTEGDRLTNLEFVTAPFDTTDEGLRHFQQAMEEIGRIVLVNLGDYAGRPGPGIDDNVKKVDPPHRYTEGHYVTVLQHRLPGSAQVAAGDALFSRGTKEGRFKMQATAGASLAHLPAIMETFGTARRETAAETANRAKAREMMTGSPAPAGEVSRVLGHSPTLAREAVRRMASDPTLARHRRQYLSDEPDALIGFLSAVFMYIKMLQLPSDNWVKYRVPYMFRSSFPAMFATLPRRQRRTLSDATLLKTHVVGVNNDYPLFASGWDSALAPDTPLIRRPRHPDPTIRRISSWGALEAVTIGRWLEGIVSNRDYLEPAVLDAFLGTLAVDDRDREEAVANVQGFASMGTDEVRGNPLAVFENRYIAPRLKVVPPQKEATPSAGVAEAGAGRGASERTIVPPTPKRFERSGAQLNFYDAFKHALNYLTYFIEIDRAGRPGTFDDVTARPPSAAGARSAAAAAAAAPDGP